MIIFSNAYPEEPFRLFNIPHIISLLLIITLCTMPFLFKWYLRKEKVRTICRLILCFIMVCNFLALYIWSGFYTGFDLRYDLPLELCSITSVLTVIMLLFPHKKVFEITYFLSIAGGIPALLTPVLYRYNYPHFLFFQFFIDHGLLIISPLLVLSAYRIKLKPVSILKAFAAVNLIGVFVLAVNLVIGANYMFLLRKPFIPTLFDYLGPWPWYLAVCELIALAVFGLLYLPFLVRLKKEKKRG